MGVKLSDLVVRNKIDFSRLEGTVIAVDAPNVIFSLFSFSYKNNQYNYSNFMTDRHELIHLKDEYLIIETVKEMIANKELYGQYFDSTDSVVFNQRMNRNIKEQFGKYYKVNLEKIIEIDNDAEDAYNNRQYGNFVRLIYLYAEKFIHLLYNKTLDAEAPYNLDDNLGDLLRAVEERLNTKLGIREELNEWRIIRNKIVHDNLKLEKKKALKAKSFFEELRTKFNHALKLIEK